jgi:outer membrane lipoprotein-sorting protein
MEISKAFGVFGVAAFLLALSATSAFAEDATSLLQAAFSDWRAKSSETTVTMTVHRPSWERHLTMKTWTEGNDRALVRFVSPASDTGNATLILSDQTWVYNPKLNQVIRLPASLLAQSWMGSDFSYKDLAKADDILTDYTHQIVHATTSEGHQVYTIDAMPKPGAPVVWGKLQAVVRDDGVFLGQTYFDQTMKPVREMVTTKVGPLGGRNYPIVMKMQPADESEDWTTIETTEGQFDTRMADNTFTRSNLENPRD